MVQIFNIFFHGQNEVGMDGIGRQIDRDPIGRWSVVSIQGNQTQQQGQGVQDQAANR